ncbi:anthrax toxin lethal factor-related metalloendopeptidase [Metabacillus sp. FJAT-53654]|uniref:Toxin n=1 Tax=Metabacillus rhizosphaerae TaxID=3117747 RepID=A0ABZ2MM38_9BACI
MKKGIFILIISFICIPFYHLARAVPEGIPLSTYSFKSLELTLSKPIIGEMVFLPDGSFAEDEALIMIKNLQKIDQNILMIAAEQNIQIKLFNGSLTDQKGLTSLKDKKPRGYADSSPNWNQVPGMSNDRVVYAKIGHSEYGKGHGSVSLELHEVAHAIDRYVFHYVREDPTFLAIWKQEVEQLFPNRNYFINFPEEYFAEAFAMYYYNNDTRFTLEEKAPLTFSFIQSLENQAAIQTQKSYVNVR